MAQERKCGSTDGIYRKRGSSNSPSGSQGKARTGSKNEGQTDHRASVLGRGMEIPAHGSVLGAEATEATGG